MLRFIWINLIGIIYFTSAATAAFVIFCIIITPILWLYSPSEIDWFVLIVYALMAAGYPVAFAKSYKSIITDLREVWKSVKLR